MELVAEERPGLLLVSIRAERIDAAAAIQFKDRMRELVQAHGGAPRIMLDMSHVAFLDSSGLGAVVAVMKLMGPDRQLELAGLTPTVEKVFRLTRMDSVFTVHPLVPDGLRNAG